MVRRNQYSTGGLRSEEGCHFMGRRGTDWNGDCKTCRHREKIVVGDKKSENAEAIAKIMKEAGFDVVPVQIDLSDKTSVLDFIRADIR